MLERAAVIVNPHKIKLATARSFKRQQAAIKAAFNVFYDPEHQKRLEEQKCITCYYLEQDRISQRAFFSQPCGICMEPQVYGSSHTNILCLNCAQKSNLCLQCAADILNQGNQNATGNPPSS